MEAQILGAVVSFVQSQKQAKMQEASARNEALTETFNANQRIRDKLEKLKKVSAGNRARGAASGVDAWSGSSINVEQGNLGEAQRANFEDIFNTDMKVSKINEAGRNKAAATRLTGVKNLLANYKPK